jgi:hypothetical protein
MMSTSEEADQHFRSCADCVSGGGPAAGPRGLCDKGRAWLILKNISGGADGK